jgi:hypothetical protein
MRIAFVISVVLGCGLLVTCELAHADSIKLAVSDPACQQNATPPQPGPVTCFNANSGSNFVNLGSPTRIQSNFYQTTPSADLTLQLAVSSSL